MEKRKMTFIARLVSLALLLNLWTSTPAVAQSPSTFPAEKIAKIETAISAHASRLSIPGISVAIVVDNQLRWQGSYGTADLENFVPAKPLTVYRIASVTKALSAVAAMQLVEKGKLDLDAQVQKYAPSFPVKSFPITTRQLLAHLSGVRGYKQSEGERTNHYPTLTEALTIFKDDPLEHEPVARYTYTTFGYTLLGVVIEGASGMSYVNYMQEHIFRPAGMTHTYPDNVFNVILNRARGYSPRVYGVFDGNYRNPYLMDSSYKLPGGGLLSTSEDLARFAIAVLNGLLIKKETLEQMSKNQKTTDGRETGYGYGWYIGRIGKWSEGSISHGGVQQGFTSDLWLLPRKRFALVILTNLEGGGRLGLATLGNQIADIVLQ